MNVAGEMIGSVVFSAIALVMSRIFVKSLKEGIIYFNQWKDVSRFDNPKEFRKAIRYHAVNILLFDIGAILVVLKYFFRLDI